MHRIASILSIGALVASLSGCQLITALLPDATGGMPEVGTCAIYELVDPAGGEVTPDRIEQTRSIIQNRVNATGVADVVVDADESGLLSVGIPVFAPDHEVVQEIRALVSAPGVLAFMPVPAELQGLVEEGPLPALMRDQEPLFTGEEIESAAPAQDQTTGEYVVSLRFKDAGARLFDAFAQEHFGEQFAIVFDDEVMSAPMIHATRFGGEAQISGGAGGFTLDEIQRLVTVLRYGSLPLEVREVAFGACETPSSAEATPVPSQASTAGARVIELEATAWLTFDQDGRQVLDIPVVPGETILFRIDNTAGFDHSFWIGTDAELAIPDATTEEGIPAWPSGIRELAWTVPEEVDGLMFACTVPGHYYTMRGCFSEARLGADGNMERVGEAGTCPLAGLDPVAVVGPEWQLGGRVEVPWAGIALTFPDGWEVSVDADPGDGDAWLAIPVLSAFDASYLGARACFVMAHGGSDFDWTMAESQADAVFERGDAHGVRFDSITPLGDGTSFESTFIIGQPGKLITLECTSDGGLDDDWLSIAETIEFLPVDR